jgi:anti-anti-sigma regulatory factor
MGEVAGAPVMAPTNSKLMPLPAVVDLDAVELLRDGLLDAIEQGPVIVSGRAVERVSTNALFMLMSAAETARRSDCSFVVAEASPVMLAAIARLGLDAHFAGILKG